MKHQYLLSLLVIVLLCSCGIQKRHHRPGFYVPVPGKTADSRQSAMDKKTDDTEAGSSMPLAVTSSETLELEAEIFEDPQLNIPALISAKKIRTSVPAQCAKITEIIKETKATQTRQEIRRAGSPDVSGFAKALQDELEWLVLVGGLTILAGLLTTLAGALLHAVNPVVAEGVVCVGILMMIVGLFAMGIGDPELMLDFLIEGLIKGLAAC